MSRISSSDPIIQALTQNLALNPRQAKDLLYQLFDCVKKHVSAGAVLKVNGFGSFEVRAKAERPGRNPKTKEAVCIQARRVPRFRPAPTFAAQLRIPRPETF